MYLNLLLLHQRHDNSLCHWTHKSHLYHFYSSSLHNHYWINCPLPTLRASLQTRKLPMPATQLPSRLFCFWLYDFVWFCNDFLLVPRRQRSNVWFCFKYFVHNFAHPLLIMTSPYIPGKIFSMHRLSLYCVFMYFIWSFCGIIIALIFINKRLSNGILQLHRRRFVIIFLFFTL